MRPIRTPYPTVTLPATEQRELTARRSGRAYRLMIAHPAGPPPSAAGYPVIYLLDGNAAFGTMTEAVRLRSRRPEATGIASAVVVGIGYPTDEPLDLERRTYDLTPPAERHALGPRPDGSIWPETGGANEFLDVIADEMKPIIARDFAIDPDRQTLFGHSLGGLLVLHALFTRPAMFQTYVAASPSIWWNDRAILREEDAFTKAIAAKALQPAIDVLITVGGREQGLTPPEAGGDSREMRAAWKQRNRMVDNARELASRLSTLAGHGLRAALTEFEDEDHVSVIPAAISRAVTVALGARP